MIIHSPRRAVLVGLLILLTSVACTDTSCGGCVAPLSEPFPVEPRVYDGVQLRVERSGFDFIQDNFAVILGSLLADGLTFDIPPTNIDLLITEVDICDPPCPLQIEITSAYLSLIPTQTIGVDATVDVDGDISMDTTIIFPVHCDFDLEIRDKPISAQVILQADMDSHFFTFEIADLGISIEEDDYDIQCPPVFDEIMEALKGALTTVLNTALQTQLDTTIGGLIAEQTCLPCDFYTGGCPAGSGCNSDGFCESDGDCLIKPLGLIGTLDLGSQLESVDPTNDAVADLLVALGQAQQPSQRPFVRNNGLELRMIGGTYADQNPCIPDPNPQDIPPAGLAPAMNFSGIVPGTGESYMVGVAITDKYLDHFFYQLWRSGLLCLALDSYGVDQISSQTLGLFIPSINLIADQGNLPVRLEIHPEGVPYMEVGAGTFLPDGSMDEPILYVFVPDFRMDFWMKYQGRWIRFLSLMQDIRVDLGLEFTADNQLIPILDEDSVVVDNVSVSHHELLAEDEATLETVVPQLVGMFLPILTDTMGEIAIPDLQGFVLDIKSVEGNLERGNTGYYEFMGIYADLSFTPPPPPVTTRARIGAVRPEGVDLEVLDSGTEVQFRIDDGPWSPFQHGPVVRVRRWLLPGSHTMEVRARRIGDYRTLDPDSIFLPFETREVPEWEAVSARSPESQPGLRPAAAQSDPAAEQVPKAGCTTTGSTAGCLGLAMLIGFLFLRRKR